MTIMIKYRYLLVLIATSTLILSGCTGSPDDKDEAQSTPAPIIKEVKSLPDADITIPAGLVGTELTASNQSEVQEENETTTSTTTDNTSTEISSGPSDEVSYKENADGTITYSLSGDQRTSIVNELSADITQSIQTILDSDDYYPNIISIIPNEDGTCFTIALADGQMNTYEAMLVMSFYTVGDKYQLYKGVPADQVKTTVIYTNESTGEIISQSDSTSMNTFTTN